MIRARSRVLAGGSRPRPSHLGGGMPPGKGKSRAGGAGPVCQQPPAGGAHGRVEMGCAGGAAWFEHAMANSLLSLKMLRWAAGPTGQVTWSFDTAVRGVRAMWAKGLTPAGGELSDFTLLYVMPMRCGSPLGPHRPGGVPGLHAAVRDAKAAVSLGAATGLGCPRSSLTRDTRITHAETAG